MGRVSLLAGLFFLLAAGHSARAASETWSSTSNGNWSTTGNWLGGAAPGGVSGTTDVATFNTGTGVTVTIDSTSQYIKSLAFTGSTTGAFTIGGLGADGGNSLLLTTGGSITDSITDTAVTTETINAPMVLEPASGTTTGTYGFTNNASAGNLLNIGGNVTGDTTTAAITLTLGGTNTGANTVSGSISNGNAASFAVVKSGVGTWVLSGANTYTGGTTINGGTLDLGANNALTTTGAVTLNETVAGGTATLNLNGFNQTIGALTFGGTGSTNSSTNNITGTGTLTLGGTVTFSGSSTLGPLSSTISVTTLDLGGVNRTFQINHSTINGTNPDLTISSVIQDGALNKNGVGILLLSGSNTYAGGTTDQGTGTLLIGNANALGTGNLAISAATVASSSSAAETVANTVSMSNGTSAIFGTSGTGNLTFGAMTIGSGSGSTETLTVNNASTTVASLTYNTAGVSGTITKQGTGAFVVAGNNTLQNITYDIQGGMFAVAGATFTANNLKLDGGVVGLNGSYTKSLGTTTAGLVQWATNASGGFAAYGTNATWGNSANNLTVDIGNTGATLVFGSTADFLSSGAALILGNASSDGTVTFQNGLDLAGVTQTVQVNQGVTNTNDGYDAVLSGLITDGALTKTGTGAVALTDATGNTYAGGTTISAGTLSVNNTSGSGTGTGAVAVNSGGTLSGTGMITPTLASGYGVTVATGGTITPGGVQPAPVYTPNPTNLANGNLTLNPTNITGGNLLSVGTSSNAAPSLNFALGSGNSSSQIVVAGSTTNVINFNVGGTSGPGGTSSVVSINDLVGGSLTLNQEYVLIAGNGHTTYEDNGLTLNTAGDLGAVTAEGQQIIGGLSLLEANTPGNFFSSWYGSSELFLVGDNIDIEVIPEPGTWAMMLGGWIVLLFWQRRRHIKG